MQQNGYLFDHIFLFFDESNGTNMISIEIKIQLLKFDPFKGDTILINVF